MGLKVSTYLDDAKDVVTLDVRMGQLNDGTTYASNIALDAKAKTSAAAGIQSIPAVLLVVIAPIEGTPAARAGLQAGDIIFRIEGQETIDLTVQDAVRKLKGEKGTKVPVTIRRPGGAADFDVTLVRDEIPTHSIASALMVRPEVGMIRITNFTGTPATELDEAIRKLKAQGMKNLLLDLRGNHRHAACLDDIRSTRVPIPHTANVPVGKQLSNQVGKWNCTHQVAKHG